MIYLIRKEKKKKEKSTNNGIYKVSWELPFRNFSSWDKFARSGHVCQFCSGKLGFEEEVDDCTNFVFTINLMFDVF